MTLKLHTDLSSRGHDTIFTGDGKLRNKEKDQNDKCRLYPAGGGGILWPIIDPILVTFGQM